MCCGAVDEEAQCHRRETERELGGNGKVLAALACAGIHESEDRAEDEDPDRVERLELRRRPVPQVQAEDVEAGVDVAQREQAQRGRHLLVEDEEEHRLHGQHQGGDQAGALAALAAVDQVGEDAQYHDAGAVDEDFCQAFGLQHQGRSEHGNHTQAQHGEQLVDLHGFLVRRRTDVVECMAHQEVEAQADQQADAAHAERGMPAHLVVVGVVDVILDQRRCQHRERRAQIHRHVVDGEGTVDLGIIAFVDLAHQVAGIGFEQAIADHDHAQRAEQEPHALAGYGHQCVTHREDERTQQHGASGAQHLVADPAADRRRHVDQGGGRTPGQVGAIVGEAQPLHHVVDDERLHAVVAEALPHFDQEHRAEGAGLRDGRILGCHMFSVRGSNRGDVRARAGAEGS